MRILSQEVLKAAIQDDAASRAFLRNVRWPNGFQCPSCGNKHGHEVVGGRFWSCSAHGCRYRTCLRVGTFLEGSRKPIRMWLKALHAFLDSERGLTAPQLQAAMNHQISLPTAWNWLQRFREILQNDPWIRRSSLALRMPRRPKCSAWSTPKPNRSALSWHRSESFVSKAARPFAEWLLLVYSGRTSAKHLDTYWTEYRFRSISPGLKRWERYSSCLDRTSLTVQSRATAGAIYD